MNNKGYWFGKKRDENTINALSRSKYKNLLQYDSEGKLVKVWDSIKDAAIKIVGDYKVINGSAESKLYDILRSRRIKNRLYKSHYWIKIDEIKSKSVPSKINLDKIVEDQKKVFSKKIRNNSKCNKQIYQVDKNGKILKIYKSIKAAAAELNIHASNIGMCCRYQRKSAGGRFFIFKNIKNREKYYYNKK